MKPSATAALSTTPTLPVLSFWRDLEIFNIPAAPSDRDKSDLVKVVTMRPGDELTWHRAQFQPTEQHSYIHVIHVGVADTEDLARLLQQATCPGQGTAWMPSDTPIRWTTSAPGRSAPVANSRSGGTR